MSVIILMFEVPETEVVLYVLMRVCVRVHVCARVRLCVCACVRACAYVYTYTYDKDRSSITTNDALVDRC